ncbi:Hypothetical predicted protein [Marmota monax]|uniref:Uncharacterized protein n=1 Tax=Marmota monax TaxID=9995 RepID=A0A5E4DAM6_MARMO|nr:hypothetical protein GHT09_008205 [Marmota monax]VTJ90810.1 Hypothetical predicted protein [Marmota monax]
MVSGCNLHQDSAECPESILVSVAEGKTQHLRKHLQTMNPEWLHQPEDWTFLSALFFCCTVFSTVGECGGNGGPAEMAQPQAIACLQRDLGRTRKEGGKVGEPLRAQEGTSQSPTVQGASGAEAG